MRYVLVEGLGLVSMRRHTSKMQYVYTIRQKGNKATVTLPVIEIQKRCFDHGGVLLSDSIIALLKKKARFEEAQ